MLERMKFTSKLAPSLALSVGFAIVVLAAGCGGISNVGGLGDDDTGVVDDGGSGTDSIVVVDDSTTSDGAVESFVIGPDTAGSDSTAVDSTIDDSAIVDSAIIDTAVVDTMVPPDTAPPPDTTVPPDTTPPPDTTIPPDTTPLPDTTPPPDTTTTDTALADTKEAGIACNGKTCAASEVCCASTVGGTIVESCATTCSDGGTTLRCTGSSDCGGTSPYCCGTLTLSGGGGGGGGCSASVGTASCTGSCTSDRITGCSGTHKARLCTKTADCADDAANPKCCTLPGSAQYVCASAFASLGGATCM